MSASIFWDLENCQLSSTKSISDVKYLLSMLNGVKEITEAIVIGKVINMRNYLIDELECAGFIYNKNITDEELEKTGSADIALLDEIYKTIYKNKPGHIIILISGDKDFCKVLRKAKEEGHYVILLYSSKATQKLKDIADISLSWKYFLDQVDDSDSSHLSDTSNTNYRYCKVEFFCSTSNFRYYNLYSIPNDIGQLNKGDIVHTSDNSIHNGWNVGRVVKLLYRVENLPQDHILNIYNDASSFIATISERNIINDKLMTLAKSIQKKINMSGIKIIDVEYRLDKKNITIRYIKMSEITNYKLFIELFTTCINTQYPNTRIKMLQRKLCINDLCRRKYCLFVHI